MYKYTFDQKLRFDFFERREIGTKWWDTQWRCQVAFISEIGAEHYNIFQIMNQIRKFSCYYSEKELEFIPVGGWLIPAKFFEKRVVK